MLVSLQHSNFHRRETLHSHTHRIFSQIGEDESKLMQSPKGFMCRQSRFCEFIKKHNTDFGNLHPANNKVYGAVVSYQHKNDHVHILPVVYLRYRDVGIETLLLEALLL